MRLCMFHPLDQPLERGWVGRVDEDRVVHLAAQTLQSYFLGGGGAREHAVYPADAVAFLAPVLQPPTVRVFDAQDAFAFANTAAIVGPGAIVDADGPLDLLPRLAAVVGADGGPGGFTLFAEWRNERRPAPKDRDFALATGPYVVTPDSVDAPAVTVSVAIDGAAALEEPAPGFDWPAALALAAENTTLRPGDLIAGPAHGSVVVPRTAAVSLAARPLGVLSLTAGPLL